MKWMKFTDFEGDTVWLNMALAERLYTAPDSTANAGICTRIVFGNDCGISVEGSPEEIIARGEWLVK